MKFLIRSDALAKIKIQFEINFKMITRMQKINKTQHFVSVGVLILISILIKIILLADQVFPFNADEAIIALMARHINQGELPTFFYGQVYMGSLDAFLVAFVFRVFGESIWGIRFVQIVLSTFVIFTSVYLSYTIFKSQIAGLVTGLLLSVPTVNYLLYTTVSLGGYVEALLIGNLLMIIGLILLNDFGLADKKIYNRKTLFLSLLFGFLSGLGLWANALTLIYSVPLCVLLVLKLIKTQHAKELVSWVLLIFIFGLIGAFPWVLYGIKHGMMGLLSEITGSAVSVENGSYLAVIGQHIINYVLFGLTALFGLRPPWSTQWLSPPLAPFALTFWIISIAFFIRGKKRKIIENDPYYVILSIFLTFTLCFIFSSFGVDPSGRYFLPMFVLLTIIGGGFIAHAPLQKTLKIGFVLLVVFFNLIGTIQCALQNPPGITTQFYEPSAIDQSKLTELADFLIENNELSGYTNYWVSYPLAFISQEKLIYVPRLPYHLDLSYTSRDDRYEPYTTIVQSSEKVAYITTKNPYLDQILTKKLQENGISWKEQVIGDYHVYYSLSHWISPEVIGLP